MNNNKRYAVTLVCPPGYPHILALSEIAETLHYALLALGYDSIITSQMDTPDRRHIVLGANLLSKYNLGQPGTDSIIYNFEQIDDTSTWLDKTYLTLLKTHEVWDYSERNISLLRQNGVNNIHHMPIGHMPELERIQMAAEQDIDVLFYGSMNGRRQKVLSDLRARGLNVQQVFGLYGADRDALIARSKIVLNVHFYESKIFEIARISYLLANGVCVVSETGPDPMEKDFNECVAFTSYDGLVDTCFTLAADAERRYQLGTCGQALMRTRPQSQFLKRHLQSSSTMANHVLSFRQDTPIITMNIPSILNMGSGKDWREDALNVDIEPEWAPDILFDFNTPLPPGGIGFATQRFGSIRLTENHFNLIRSFDVLEHIQQLTTAMTTCLTWLKEGGIFQIHVPYDLSYGAWQDPTHVRAFNEKSWLYYTDWFWYLGWDRWRFDIAELKYILNPIGQELHEKGTSLDIIIRTPRAVDSMIVNLCKRQLTDPEKEFVRDRRKKII